MADINSVSPEPSTDPAASNKAPGDKAVGDKALIAEARFVEAMELLFFAYRDFVSDPDTILERQGFGRAHHRVLHFVGRNPGITVQNLLAILQITKQSLARVLRQLIEAEQIEQRTGAQDRRERHLHLTDKGQEFWHQLQTPQRVRLERAFATVGPEGEAAWRQVMDAMLDRASRNELHPGTDHLTCTPADVDQAGTSNDD